MKTQKHREFLREFTDGVKRGQLTVHRLSGLYMEPIKKDGTVIMALHTGSEGHGIVVALSPHTALTLLHALGAAMVEISDSSDRLRDGLTLNIELEPYDGEPIVRVRAENPKDGLVPPGLKNEAEVAEAD